MEMTVAVGALAVALLASADGAGPADALRNCETAVRKRPNDYTAYECFRALAHTGRRRDAERSLRSLLAEQPSNPYAQSFLASSYSERGAQGAEQLFRSAAAGFAAAKNPWGETDARASLANLLCVQESRCDLAEEELRLAAQAAEAGGDPLLRATVKVWAGRIALEQQDLGRAERLILEARDLVPPDGPTWARWRVIDMLGALEYSKGRFAAALEAKRQAAELVATNPYLYASALGSVAHVAVRLAGRDEMSAEDATAAVRRALEAQAAAGSEGTSGAIGSLAEQIWPLLALLVGPTDEGMSALQRATAINRKNPQGTFPYPALWLLAKYTLDRDPSALKQSRELVDEAISLARARGRHKEVAQGLIMRTHLELRAGDRGQGMADALKALALLDRLRALQPEGRVRAEFGASTANAYQLASGYYLDSGRAGADMTQAFGVMERLRARVLDDVLSRVNSPSVQLPADLERRRAEIQLKLTLIQKRLVDPELDAIERKQAETELVGAEQEEAALRDDAARASGGGRTLARAPLPALDEVQRALGEDEAILLFQTWRPERSLRAPYTDGSSWLLLVTRDSATARRIPDAQLLEPQVVTWNRIIERRDGRDTEGGAHLYRTLFGDELLRLRGGIQRLWVVPDGPLHLLPWEALRPDPSGPALGERYQVTVIPSAAIWLRFRRAPVEEAGFGLVVGDPAPAGTASVAQRAGAAWLGGLRLGALPEAREEARSLANRLGRKSELLLGEAASEQYLKTADLTRFGLIHFATHAVVDEENAERSAVVLAPGSLQEDGLLQMREITQLKLAPGAVVLASCSSSSGALVEGEGFMGLARAFFEAGARVVVGSRWTLRDDASRALFEVFYSRLVEGRPVAEAMREARRARIRAGAPTADWAGLAVMGDGSLTPLPRAHSGTFWWIGGAALLAAVALAVGVRRWIGSRSRPMSGAQGPTFR
jgi:hypothetical protein